MLITLSTIAGGRCFEGCKKTPDQKLPLRFFTVFARAKEMLAAKQPIRDGEWTGPEVETIREKLPQLITTKPSEQSDLIR